MSLRIESSWDLKRNHHLYSMINNSFRNFGMRYGIHRHLQSLSWVERPRLEPLIFFLAIYGEKDLIPRYGYPSLRKEVDPAIVLRQAVHSTREEPII